MLARIKNGRLVVRISNNVTSLQHRGEQTEGFVARCNGLAHYLMGK